MVPRHIRVGQIGVAVVVEVAVEVAVELVVAVKDDSWSGSQELVRIHIQSVSSDRSSPKSQH